MKILDKKIKKEELINFDNETFFEDMIKCVVDIDKEQIAISAELHSDLEALMLDKGSSQKSLYGINIIFGDWEIEYDSLINPPRNRDAGFPRGGRDVCDPVARAKIAEIVNKWIEM